LSGAVFSFQKWQKPMMKSIAVLAGQDSDFTLASIFDADEVLLAAIAV